MRSAFAVFLRGFVLPFGATTGRRIVFDGVNGTIQFYDSSNNLRLQISTGLPSEIQFFTADAAEELAGRIRALVATINGKDHLLTRVSSPSVDAVGFVTATVELRSQSTDSTVPPMIALKATISTDDLTLGILDDSSGTRTQPMGTITLGGGAPNETTVTHSWVTASSRIITWRQAPSGPQGHLYVTGQVAGSFKIGSSDAADLSVVGYLVIEPL
jgi:hypothetical protein